MAYSFDLVSAPPLGELSRRGLKIFGALVEGSSLKRLDEKNWPLGLGDRSIACGPYSPLGCIRVLTFTHLNRTRRLASLGQPFRRSCCQSSPKASSLDFFRSIPNRGARGGIFPDGRGIVHVLCFPQVGRGFNPSLLEGLVPDLGTVEPAYPRNLSLEGSLGLGHSQVVGLLLGLLLGALSLRPGKHCLLLGPLGLAPSPFSHVFGLLYLSQFFL